MKQIPLIILLAFLQSGCKKNHVCKCDNGYIGFGETEYYDTKRKAEKKCNDLQIYGTFTYSNITYTDVKCKLR